MSTAISTLCRILALRAGGGTRTPNELPHQILSLAPVPIRVRPLNLKVLVRGHILPHPCPSSTRLLLPKATGEDRSHTGRTLGTYVSGAYQSLYGQGGRGADGRINMRVNERQERGLSRLPSLSTTGATAWSGAACGVPRSRNPMDASG